ncbi:MAG: hypothetical protein KF687_08280 [Cyclobacteriaceae bacterium]|nr:hypothetical protein [Cyclobacteriaceae bacterium]
MLKLIGTVTFISLFSLYPVQTDDHDARLIGKWKFLYTKDAGMNILKDEFTGKGYIETFTKNGQYLIDPKYLQDDMKRHGINEPIDHSLIPTFTWKTINNEILEISEGRDARKCRYGFSGDTLLLGYPNGHVRYLLKRK